MGQECQFLIFWGSTQKMKFLNISSVFWHCWNHHFSPSLHAFFVVSAGPRPTQPNPTSQPSPAQPGQPASQPTHPKITNYVSNCVKRSKNRFSEWYPKSPEAECTKTRRHGPNRTEQEPDRPQTDAKKVYWKPFPGASKTGVFISYSFCGFLIFWVNLGPQN